MTDMSDIVSTQSGRTDTDIPLKGCPFVRLGGSILEAQLDDQIVNVFAKGTIDSRI